MRRSHVELLRNTKPDTIKTEKLNLADTLDATEVKVLWWLNTKTVETWLWTNTDNQLLGAERNKTQL